MEEIIDKLRELVKQNYKPYTGSWTAERSSGNFDDCFEDGSESGSSWLAYEVGCILGMELVEPDELEDEE